MIHEETVPKPLNRAYSRYSLEAITLLGQMIRAGRIERKITGEEMASRMGASRALIQRIEKETPAVASERFLKRPQSPVFPCLKRTPFLKQTRTGWLLIAPLPESG